jgi:uncharacterized protein YjbI with pentapeptide repeats
MSQYSPEEVVEKITAGQSLEGADLERIDLSCKSFRTKELNGPCEKPANLSGANLKSADLKKAI